MYEQLFNKEILKSKLFKMELPVDVGIRGKYGLASILTALRIQSKFVQFMLSSDCADLNLWDEKKK